MPSGTLLLRNEDKIKYKYIETDGFAEYRFLIKVYLILLFKVLAGYFVILVSFTQLAKAIPETGRGDPTIL